MIYRFIISILLCVWIVESCETPFTPEPSKNEDLFDVNHDYVGGQRLVSSKEIIISWSEVTISGFARCTIHRSVFEKGTEKWEQRGEVINPLQTYFTDIFDDDKTYRYKVRIEDTDGNFRESETDQIVLKTTSVFSPDEFETLQEAYDSPFIDHGDTIYAHPGVYPGPLNFSEKDVYIRGIEGSENTDIVAKKIVLLSMSRGVLSGFTIKDGYGINLSGTAVISDCVIRNHRTGAMDQAGIVVSGQAKVINCLIARNRKTDLFGRGGVGGGMIVKDNAVVQNCRITRNTASIRGGGIVTSGQPIIINTIISNNFGYNGGGGIYVTSGSTPIIVNCLIYRNETRKGAFGAVMLGSRSTLKLVNSIVWDNSSAGSESLIWINSSFSNIEGGYGESANNINLDPLFVDPDHGDFHLMPDSPCIDTGHPGDIYLDSDGTRNDMGAFGGPFGQ